MIQMMVAWQLVKEAMDRGFNSYLELWNIFSDFLSLSLTREREEERP